MSPSVLFQIKIHLKLILLTQVLVFVMKVFYVNKRGRFSKSSRILSIEAKRVRAESELALFWLESTGFLSFSRIVLFCLHNKPSLQTLGLVSTKLILGEF